MESPTFKDFCNSAGRGFIMGQGFAAVSSLSHSILHTPNGSKIKNFFSEYSHLSFINGTNMAQWSIVQLTIDPIIKKSIKKPWLQNVLGGALTGAVLEWRNGTKGMFSGAVQGAGQSLLMSFVGPVIGIVAKPINDYRIKKQIKDFHDNRGKEVFQHPINAMYNAFFNKL